MLLVYQAANDRPLCVCLCENACERAVYMYSIYIYMRVKWMVSGCLWLYARAFDVRVCVCMKETVASSAMLSLLPSAWHASGWMYGILYGRGAMQHACRLCRISISTICVCVHVERMPAATHRPKLTCIAFLFSNFKCLLCLGSRLTLVLVYGHNRLLSSRLYAFLLTLSLSLSESRARSSTAYAVMLDSRIFRTLFYVRMCPLGFWSAQAAVRFCYVYIIWNWSSRDTGNARRRHTVALDTSNCRCPYALHIIAFAAHYSNVWCCNCATFYKIFFLHSASLLFCRYSTISPFLVSHSPLTYIIEYVCDVCVCVYCVCTAPMPSYTGTIDTNFISACWVCIRIYVATS